MVQSESFFTQFGNRLRDITRSDNDPQFLCRYRSVSTPYFEDELERLFKTNEVYWPIQRELNDPFDCQPVFKKDISLREFRKKILPVLVILRAQVTRELMGWKVSDVEFRRFIKKNIKDTSLTEIKDTYDSRLENLVEMTFREVSVLSLCADYNNPVMWSMYGGRGNGICLGFTNKLHATSFGEKEKWWASQLKVRYVEDRPVYDLYGALATFLYMTPDAAHYIPKQYQKYLLRGLEQHAYLWTKNIRWSYEQEYRSILHLGYSETERPDRGQYRGLEGLELSSIRIGPDVADAKVFQITEIARSARKRVQVFHSRRSSSSYALDFEPL